MSRLSKNDSSQAMQNLFSAYGGDDADVDESKVEHLAFADDEELSDHSGTPTESKSTATEKLQAKANSEKSDKDDKQRQIEPAAKKLKLERKGLYS